jgi:hypothetical protein
MAENYYTSRKRNLLRDFDKTVGQVRHVFDPRFADSEIDSIIAATRREYESLIPDLPDVGGRQPFTQFVIATGWFLAMYRVLIPRGVSLEGVGRLVYEATGAFLEAYPRLLRRLFGQMTFSRRYMERARRRAAESHEGKYPRGYVYDFVEGDGETFDYGIDYRQCASCLFLEEHGALELAPYLCAMDVLYSEALGWGLKRTQTLAEGYDKCDFRFLKGGETRVTVAECLLEQP